MGNKKMGVSDCVSEVSFPNVTRQQLFTDSGLTNVSRQISGHFLQRLFGVEN